MEGKVITVTGGASGIGLALVRLLAEQGASLSIADLNTRGLDALEAEFKDKHPNYLYTRVNIAVEAEVRDWIAATTKHFGRPLDGAGNCAGIVGLTNKAMPLTAIKNANWDLCLAVNLTGNMYCMREELRNMADGGSVVSVASVAGLEGLAGLSPSCAAKHGVIGLTRAVAKEIGECRIRANVVAPGNIDTPLLAAALKGREGRTYASAIPRDGTPTEVATMLLGKRCAHPNSPKEVVPAVDQREGGRGACNRARSSGSRGARQPALRNAPTIVRRPRCLTGRMDDACQLS
ncbi:hypothetical protein SEUCBS139899_008650 [Sporothrix eucalyptigena]|uniref:Uncharacterized protein n=1 Tax=Sporothrix eucalyptigena TaxID=1812306 RepID=A0ABP0CMG6_9PEZI